MSTSIDPNLVVSCDVRTGSWDFEKDASLLGTFGSNKTFLTSLTPKIFAITDGYDVEYHYHGRRGGIRRREDAWPFPINVSYGVAAVAYARDLSRDETASGHTTALLGCSCYDLTNRDGTPGGIQVKCAIVPLQPVENVAENTFVVDLGWEIANTPKRMVCRDTKISVQSIRFQVCYLHSNALMFAASYTVLNTQAQKISLPNSINFIPGVDPPISCMSQKDCTAIDAAIWIMPVCPVERPTTTESARHDYGATACLQNLKDFSCFPYCLGVHRSFGANERIIIRSSKAWEESVLLTNRDCVYEKASTFQDRTSDAAFGELEGATGTWIPNTPLQGDFATMKVKAADESDTCVVNTATVSSAAKRSSDVYGSEKMFVELYKFGKSDTVIAADYATNLYRFNPTDAMLLDRQPLVFAGDYAISTVTYCSELNQAWDATEQTAPTCTTVADVVRITGNEFNEFEIRRASPYGMPTTRRPRTISETNEAIVAGAITLPPVVVRSVYLHNPAASTRDAVWYGVNPDYEMLHCALRYCRAFADRGGCMQFSVLSNYELLRVWKLIPQAGCVRDIRGNPQCPDHAAKSFLLDDKYALRLSTSRNFDFRDFCDQNIQKNLYIEHLDMFDPLNLVVSVRRGNVQALYTELWGGDGNAETDARYVFDSNHAITCPKRA